jgi:hypothetical protein
VVLTQERPVRTQAWFSLGPLDPGSWQAMRDDEDLPDFLKYLWFTDWKFVMEATEDVWFTGETCDD